MTQTPKLQQGDHDTDKPPVEGESQIQQSEAREGESEFRKMLLHGIGGQPGVIGRDLEKRRLESHHPHDEESEKP